MLIQSAVKYGKVKQILTDRSTDHTRGNWENADFKALSFRHCHYYAVLKKELLRNAAGLKSL